MTEPQSQCAQKGGNPVGATAVIDGLKIKNRPCGTGPVFWWDRVSVCGW